MQTAAPQKRGCLFYGCLTLAILSVVVIVAGYFTFRYAKNKAQAMVMEYTDDQPMPMPTVQLSEAEQADLRQRLEAFETVLEYPTNQQQLVLSSAEINALLSDPEYLGRAGSNVFIKIDDDRLQGTVSIPLQDIGPLKLEGRYLNGLATLKVSLTNNMLHLQIDEIEVKGKQLPAAVLTELQKENFAREIQNDPKVAELISRFQSIQVQDGQVILRNKVAP